MSGRKKIAKEVSIVRSSAAEYLTFVAASGTSGIDAVHADENIWLTKRLVRRRLTNLLKCRLVCTADNRYSVVPSQA